MKTYVATVRSGSLINFILRYRLISVILLQIILVIGGYLFAFFLRFDFQIPNQEANVLVATLPFLLLCRMLTYYIYKLNSGWWGFVGVVDLINIFKAVTLGTILFMIGLVFGYGLEGYPRSVVVIEAVLNLLLLGGARFGVRLFREGLVKFPSKQSSFALIVGAGQAGTQLLNEIRVNSHLGIHVVGFIDDDPMKKYAYFNGVQVLGNCKELPTLIKNRNIDEVIVAIPSAGFKRISAIMRLVKQCGIKVKVLPSLLELIQKNGLWGQLREVSFDELLERPIIKFRRESDLELLRDEIRNKSVLITGAAGSIGSELAYQVAEMQPRELILYERNENGLFFLELKLRESFPKCHLTPVIGDIIDRRKFERVVMQHKVDLVYHAAAYKHVPMMQREPAEAVRNNCFATKIVAEVAIANQVKKCVYISTDKAVNPSSIMGATKRVGEKIIQGFAGNGTKFITVRFGNVIGSSGSVVHLFRNQLEKGGPITVTHPEASRYFMSISEAVQLVMIAGAIGAGNEIFLLDMGTPVKIEDLAHKLIKASGLTPGKDIEIKHIGLRPGEKLHEELYWQGENVLATPNKKITMLKSNGFAKDLFFSQLHRLENIVNDHDEHDLLECLQEIVPEGAFAQNGRNGNGYREHQFEHMQVESFSENNHHVPEVSLAAN